MDGFLGEGPLKLHYVYICSGGHLQKGIAHIIFKQGRLVSETIDRIKFL